MRTASESEIIGAQRCLGLLWVLLLGFRYRTANEVEISTIRELCDRLERGVTSCEEYNQSVRQVVAEVRKCWIAPRPPEHATAERLVQDLDRLQRLLMECHSVADEWRKKMRYPEIQPECQS